VTERLDRFMARASAAYYATRDPFADFTTAPEISQVFGEILGLWAAVVWAAMDRPAPIVLAELGPGRGTLMADALRAAGKVAPDFAAALRVHLVETSPRLRAAQEARIPDATWHDTAEALPDGPMILLANEFLDALPVRQFVRVEGGWAERHVAAGAFVAIPCDAPPGDADAEAAEINEGALALAGALGRRFAAAPGAALFLDYGPAAGTGTGDSLQALRDGRPADPLAEPGTADLTAHVDFAAFAAAATAAGATTHGPIGQGLFLSRLGLFERTERLARGRSPAESAALLAAARRLAEPVRMGSLFKALALTSADLPTPPGFAP
jgi:SAM-dependent MidA family methyltransferase